MDQPTSLVYVLYCVCVIANYTSKNYLQTTFLHNFYFIMKLTLGVAR